MLVLSRNVNQSIRIGDDIFITVSRVQGQRVRFAIEAPKDVRIVRSELEFDFPVAEIAKTLDKAVIPLEPELASSAALK